jgi:hypothetical protein
MDASTTLEIQVSDNADQNFYIGRSFTYGEITECFLLITVAGLLLWRIVKDEFTKK